jgi:hypothetical protein
MLLQPHPHVFWLSHHVGTLVSRRSDNQQPCIARLYARRRSCATVSIARNTLQLHTACLRLFVAAAASVPPIDAPVSRQCGGTPPPHPYTSTPYAKQALHRPAKLGCKSRSCP